MECSRVTDECSAPLFRWHGRDDDVPLIRSLAELVRTVRTGPTLYVRYSEGPAADRRHGPSRDYEAEYVLPGLSVATLTPELWWRLPARTWIVRRVCTYRELDVADRFAWVLTGRRVARGPDHEPLVREVLPVGRLTDDVLDEAADEYRRRLAAGRDSRDRGNR
ncbi:hypothetical protein SAMN04489765_3395 [Tsukamurella pulmonis]|uniref:Uncharacterized protein n=1 Tax=Tsukamurella pulmonis TaxID=47312 RepID=A0A1H1GKB7_9ACTN|nr:DUF6098 family protein [Tsukamurella pulmonis]SDR13654.1 hypothetical protein SAMN04489765_3395 [Tsukamurella pulmonis]SUP17129.1 Uncharacterised protein [Tsukamurella pulmonis]